jgi:hypothetical protein
VVEHFIGNEEVMGSTPIEGSNADVAHLVERHVANVEAVGSSPIIRSK